ncbi:hypothetical protein GJ744_008478 [Endocarpon pusillum]|uniref:DUF7703 domain-containing protein n=1 Tax=Endocarpon pusillum TaxID=364733 RepID=A0A8H7A3U2_9EURO|nr:hypothetical protein GJ744_008478 [Endocarpon pusillum]
MIRYKSVSCVSHSFVLKLFIPGSNTVFYTVLAKIGWFCDTTGFSIVLYSRLHLVIRNQTALRLVLTVVIIDAFLFHTPIAVIVLGQSTGRFQSWDKYLDIFERFQILGFTIQESLISGTYIWTTARFLKSSYNKRLREVMFLLILTQLVVITMDIALILIDYIGYFTLKAALHPLAYAIKLKVEFAVLNLLLSLFRRDTTAGNFFFSDDEKYDTKTEKTYKDQRRRNYIFFERKKSPKSTAATAMSLSEKQQNENFHDIKLTREIDVRWDDRTRTNPLALTDVVISMHQKPLPTFIPRIQRLDPGSTSQWDKAEGKNDKFDDLDDIERQYLGSSGMHRLHRE